MKETQTPDKADLENDPPRRIVYVDMDNVLVDFESGLLRITPQLRRRYEGKEDEIPGLFSQMTPITGAIEAYRLLTRHYEVYILSTAPWNNPSAWSDKLRWVHHYLGEDAYKRLILTHHKELNIGDYLIDDRLKNGAGEFRGKLLHFGAEFPDWNSVLDYLLPLRNEENPESSD